MLRLLGLLLILTLSAYASKLDANLQQFVSAHPNQNIKVWIFFKDKGPHDQLSFSDEFNRISKHALQRRSKMPGDVIKSSDYPVYKPYIVQAMQHLLKKRRESRWLNAISALVTPAQIDILKEFDFISEIRLMATYKKPVYEKHINLYKNISTPQDSQYYGRSLGQLEQIGVTRMHAMGYNGKDVIIAMLDDGFNLYDRHVVFDSLDVVHTYDFVNDDNNVADRDSIPRQGWHGTQTLSVIGGYDPGHLIGSAFNARYLLAKTEIDEQEIQQEEDNWVAGLEWAEANGADIVSSSVGYWDWYSWKDMDGLTAVTTRATIVAETKGLVVVNSIGNEGLEDYPNTLGAPGDGVFVITVGGVNIDGNYYPRSSYGPTADGRIKPDVCALGTGVFRASDSDTENYFYGSGTSFSAPLTAGALALLLQAFPDLTPEEIRNAIRKTASQANTPDNFLGYGIVDIYKAYQYIKNDSLPVQPFVEKAVNSPNPFRVYTRIEYSVKAPSIVSLTVYDVSGREVLSLPKKIINGNDYEILTGNQLGANGIYFYTIRGREYASGKRISKHGKLLYVK